MSSTPPDETPPASAHHASPSGLAPAPGLIACIDAATPQLLLALGRLDEQCPEGQWLAGSLRPDDDRKNSALLIPRLESLFETSGYTLGDLSAVVCGVGPGTFTGTRVAVATAKGLALAQACPVWPLDSLSIFSAKKPEAFGQSDNASPAPPPTTDETADKAAEETTDATAGTTLVLLDARRNEVYAGLYRDGQCLMAPRCGELSDILEQVGDELGCAPTFATGSAMSFAAPTLRQRWPSILIGPSSATAEDLWQAARTKLKNSLSGLKNNVPGAKAPRAEDLAVHYLRKSYAEIGANTAKRPRYRSPFT